MENSRRCETCKIVVHRASMQKHLKFKKYLENEKQSEKIVPKWLFKVEQTPIRKKYKKVYNPKTLKQIGRANIKLDDKELDRELAKRTIIPYFFYR